MANDDYYDDYYDDEGRTWPLRLAGLSLVAVGVLAFVWFGLLPRGGDDTESQQLASAEATAPVEDFDPATTESELDESDGARQADTGADDGDPGDDPSASTDDLDASVDEDVDAVAGEDGGVADVTGEVIETDVPVTSDAVVPTPSDSTAPGTGPIDAPAPVEVNYPTLPDGSPAPVLAIYDGELITLSGAVPSEEAAQRLRVLAVANSTVPGAEVASFLTIEPTVPVGVGVRVIEMNSARFPEGSPSISPEHAAQLDRIVAVMSSLPHITVDVIGHADQRGDEATNFELSADRARAAADYVASRGIDPSRLSSRGAGESDLLTLNNDEAALALNRRTELVFFGLLVDPPASDESTEPA